MAASFEKTIKGIISARQWSNISGDWLRFLPSIQPAGVKPTFPLSEFSGFIDVQQTLTPTNSVLLADVLGLREVIFHEAVFMLHKASHVIGCAETQIKNGALTWSLSEAYQGAYFGAKAITLLLGIAVADFRKYVILIDIWPQLAVKPTHPRLSSPSDPTIRFVRIEKFSFGHYQFWQLFQRLLEVVIVDVWPAAYVDALRALSADDYAKQRNLLHYENSSWIFNDLFEFVVNDNFGLHRDGLHMGLIYEERSDFSVVLALAILKLAYILFESIAQITNKLDDEKHLLDNRFTDYYHPLYLAAHI